MQVVFRDGHLRSSSATLDIHSNENVPSLDRLSGWLARIVRSPMFVPASLFLITLVGMLLRMYKLGDWSFWGDEMFTVSGEEDGFNYSPIRKSLSLMLIQAVTAAHGVNEWNARIVPAIIGVVTIPVFYFIAKKMFDTPAALLAALFLALSPWHLYWSQNARFYVVLLLFYSLALFFFHLGTEHDKKWYLLVCLFFLALAVKERLLAFFFVPVILVYLLALYFLSFEKPKGWHAQNLALFILPGAVGGLLFAAPYLLDLPGWFSGFGFANNNPLWLAGSYAFYIGLPVVCLGGVGGLYLILQKSRTGLLLSVSAVVPPLLLLAISPLHYTASRYIFISLTSWLLLAAVGVVALVHKTTGRANILALGSLLILLASFLGDDALYYLYQNGNRENWKAAFAYVRENRQPGDYVVSGNHQIADYYLSSNTIPFTQLTLDDLQAPSHRIWFVEDMSSVEKFPELHAWVIQNAQLVSVEDVYFQVRNFSMRVYLYDPRLKLSLEGQNDAR